jgi:hypothetical protein
MNYITGIGSRNTPMPALCALYDFFKRLSTLDGARLRSGHAAGADRACEVGMDGASDIYLPWKGFGTKPYKDDLGMPVMGEAIPIDSVVQQYHRDALKDVCHTMNRQPGGPVYKLVLRNMAQVLGHGSEPEPSEVVVCWHPGQGGTMYAVHAAADFGVPVVNLRDGLDEAWERIGGILKIL